MYYPKGSEWRKWDLHLHPPGTKLADGYKVSNDENALTHFCERLAESDVQAFGITDYFSFDGFFAVKERYRKLFPRSEKVFFPNIELRLDRSVNQKGEAINIHLLFPPDIKPEITAAFLNALPTVSTEGPNRRPIRCSQLQNESQFAGASVTLDGIETAIQETFGDFAIQPDKRQEILLVIASAKGDGLRAGGSGFKRRAALSDEIDKFCDAFFSNAGSREYFLDQERYESNEKALPKPVFDGCDAHSFDELTRALGKEVREKGKSKNITWVKADPTYMGLLQSLIEPAERVRIQGTIPDKKEPYKVISKVSFSNTKDFPSEIVFNGNLCSIIGSRSSGKSALLAHIAYSINPQNTITQQELSGQNPGPAPGYSWEDVESATCKVEWESGADTQGKVIFVPQNSLYNLSDQPEQVDRKITPALFRAYPALQDSFQAMNDAIEQSNNLIAETTRRWFSHADAIEEIRGSITSAGDKASIELHHNDLDRQITDMLAEAELDEGDMEKFNEFQNKRREIQLQLELTDSQFQGLEVYISISDSLDNAVNIPDSLELGISGIPSERWMPNELQERLTEIQTSAILHIKHQVEIELKEFALRGLSQKRVLTDEMTQLLSEHDDLIKKHDSNSQMKILTKEKEAQANRLLQIKDYENEIKSLLDEQVKYGEVIKGAIKRREKEISKFVEKLELAEPTIGELTFGVECQFAEETTLQVIEGLDQRRSSNDFVRLGDQSADFSGATERPVDFFNALRKGIVKLKARATSHSVATDILCATPEVRFTAYLDDDLIGGFKPSSMTPGKQALFALTLILSEHEDSWPLLIDQPEDDLDSRSIYDKVVPFLMERKKERQIIMVSHNANLVIGADSEQVIVANRHGENSRNKDEQTFEYFSGALEHNIIVPWLKGTALGLLSINQHACEILDGGKEAFEKRRNKYGYLLTGN